jgi:hypothetical protein
MSVSIIKVREGAIVTLRTNGDISMLQTKQTTDSAVVRMSTFAVLARLGMLMMAGSTLANGSAGI